MLNSKPIDISFVRQEIDKIGSGEIEVKTFGGSTGILLRSELQEVPTNVLPRVKSRIETIISENFPGMQKQVIASSGNSITYEFSDSAAATIVENKLFESGFQTSKVSEEPSNKGIIVRLGISDWIKDNLAEKFKDNPFVVQKEDKVGPKGTGIKEMLLWQLLSP